MHQSVLLSEIVEYLRPSRDDGTLVDATIGLGGHAEALLTRYHLQFELRGTSKEELHYEIRTPAEGKTDRLSDRILKLEPGNVTEVEWEEKKEKK